ncbi:MAG: hypothetical protein ACK56I_13940, partial [bacterium]
MTAYLPQDFTAPALQGLFRVKTVEAHPILAEATLARRICTPRGRSAFPQDWRRRAPCLRRNLLSFVRDPTPCNCCVELKRHTRYAGYTNPPPAQEPPSA